jgi:hypothetical protein
MIDDMDIINVTLNACVHINDTSKIAIKANNICVRFVMFMARDNMQRPSAAIPLT